MKLGSSSVQKSYVASFDLASGWNQPKNLINDIILCFTLKEWEAQLCGGHSMRGRRRQGVVQFGTVGEQTIWAVCEDVSAFGVLGSVSS